jgi:hypothetical protein
MQFAARTKGRIAVFTLWFVLSDAVLIDVVRIGVVLIDVVRIGRRRAH